MSALEYDHIRFNLGIDSITNSGGVLGGDLDPIKAMYWTWQSGYINFKIEGYASSSTAKNHEFEFHIGGYIPPFYALQKIDLPLRNRNNIDIQLDFTKVFNSIDFSKTNHIMLPCIQAVDLAKILAHSFSINSL